MKCHSYHIYLYKSTSFETAHVKSQVSLAPCNILKKPWGLFRAWHVWMWHRHPQQLLRGNQDRMHLACHDPRTDQWDIHRWWPVQPGGFSKCSQYVCSGTQKRKSLPGISRWAIQGRSQAVVLPLDLEHTHGILKAYSRGIDPPHLFSRTKWRRRGHGLHAASLLLSTVSSFPYKPYLFWWKNMLNLHPALLNTMGWTDRT